MVYDFVISLLGILLIVYIISFTLYLVRIIKGPSISDRVLAIDALGYDLAAFMVILSIYLKSPLIAVCALSLSLWIFVLDIYVAKYLEAKEIGG